MNVQSEQAEEALSAEEVLSNAVNSYFTRSSSLQDHQNQSEAEDEAELTNLLFYSRWPLDDPEETMRRLLTKGPRQVCQYQFKKNDIVWICKSCQKDETCVLCNECFQDSEGKHEGHEVYFYHSQAGGCCDCGDEGAWDAKGFCNKHGKSSSDPMESIPDDIQEAGRYVMSQIARELVNYCEKIASSFDIENLEVSSSVDDEKVYNLLLHNDDIHTLDDVVSALESLDIAPSSGKSIAEMVHAEGCAVLGDRDTLSVIINRAKTVLTVCDLHVSIEEHNFLQRENTVLAVIRWLHRIAEVNDGMSRMICASLTIERIHAIYVTDPRLPKNIAIHLHHLFLTLMADQEFKIASSKAYALAYSKVAKLYVNGIGTQENCLFGLSVQFLNRSIYVDGMVYNYGFLNSVITSLRNILEPTEGRFATHPILLHRKYNPVLGDLKVIFTLPDTARYFCVTCIDQILKVFELFQFIHPQTRQLFQHVEYEGREWMHAFNLYLSFSSLFEYLVNWFVNESSVENIEGPVILDPLADDVDATQVFDPTSVQILPTAIDLMMAIVSAIVGWQQSRAQAASIDCEAGRMWKRVPFFPSADNIAVVNDSDVARDDVTTTLVQRIDDKCDTAFETHFSTSFGFLDIPEDLEEKSFHLFLHRFLATSIREACRHPHLSDTIADLQQYLSVTYTDFTSVDDVDHHQNECQLTQLIDYPLQTIVWECQIRADMWRRNGHSMLDQVLNYSEPPFCRIFKDLDILLIQLCADTYGINRLINHMIHRFGVFEYLRTKTVKSQSKSATFSKLTESMLLLLITMVTDLPLPAFSDQSKRVECLLRREVVHKLAGGNAAYSELQECMGLVPECEKVKSSVLDDVIAHVAVSQESSSALEPSKFKIKDAAWAEYDPCFTHVGEKTHQYALEMRPKKSNISRPMCPDFNNLPVHPAFFSVRHCTLSDPTLLTIVRDLLRASMIDRISPLESHSMFPTASHPQYAYYVLQKEWTLRCSAAVFSKSLQLLTLIVHNLSRPKYCQDNDEDSESGERGGESKVLSVQERQTIFETFLLSPTEIFQTPMQSVNSRLGSIIESHDENDSSDREEEALHSDVVVQLPPLLNTIMDIYDSLSITGTDEDIFNKQSLLWIIGKLESTLSAKCGEVIENRMKQELHEKRRLEMKEKREKARERAMLAMKKNATAFAEHMEKEGITASSDDEEDEELFDTSNDDDSTIPKCIICRSQHRNDDIGYLGLSQLSKFLSHDQNRAKEIHLDSIADHVINMSEEKRVSRNIFDESSHLHVQFCGHAMHARCFDLFFATVIDRAENQNNLILDPNQGFFQCPLCKKLGNVLLPHTPDQENSKCRGANVIEEPHHVNHDNNDDWIECMAQSVAYEGAIGGRMWSEISATQVPPSATDNSRSSIGQASASLKRIHESLTSSSSSLSPPSLDEQEQHQRQRQATVSRNDRNEEFEMSISDENTGVNEEVEETKPTRRRSSAMSTLVGLFRDITRYSHSRFNDSPASQNPNIDNSESDIIETAKPSQLDSAMGDNVDFIAQEELRFQNQSLWFRFIGDLCQPIVPTPKLSTDIQQYELVPLRVTSSISAIAFSLGIDFLENGSFFDNVIEYEHQWAEKRREAELNNDEGVDNVEDVSMSDNVKAKNVPAGTQGDEGEQRYNRILNSFSGKKGSEGCSKSKNIRLLSMLVRGVGAYIHSLDINDCLRELIMESLVERGGFVSDASTSEIQEKGHWTTRIRFSSKMLGTGLSECTRSFSNKEVSSLLWKEDCGNADSGNVPSGVNKKFDNGSRRKSDWFSLPLLAMPLSDVLVFLLATLPGTETAARALSKRSRSDTAASAKSADVMDVDEEDSRSSTVFTLKAQLKWICVASLIQLSIAVATDRDDECRGGNATQDDKASANLDASLSESQATVEAVLDAFPTLSDTIAHGINDYHGSSAFGDLKDERYFRIVNRILTKWLLFLHYSLHVVGRCCPELAVSCAVARMDIQKGEGSVFKSSGKDEAIKSDNVSKCIKLTVFAMEKVLIAVGLMDYSSYRKVHTVDDSTPLKEKNIVMATVSRWIRSLKMTAITSKSISSYSADVKVGAPSVLSTDDVSRLVRSRVLTASYPRSPEDKPNFVSLPNSYTKLHGMLTSICDYDYPALCMTCGSVIDASGKGLCTTHNADCASGVGIYFLLQDCTVLLLDGLRGTYYPAPYVDAHGEKHRSFRGKPLFIDAKRLKMLYKLWMSHGLPNEVASKRSNSTRVIINGHY